MQLKFETQINKQKFLDFAKDNKYFLTDYYLNQLELSKKFERSIIGKYLDGSYKFIMDEDRIIGFYKIEKLPWDSIVFNRNMGKMTLMINFIDNRVMEMVEVEMLREFSNESIEHISCQVVSNNYPTIKFLEKLKFNCVDNIIRFGTNLKKWKRNDYSKSDLIKIRTSSEKDASAIITLSNIVFKDYPSRFNNDITFTSVESDKLYSEWTSNSLKGYADLIIVAEKENEIIGFSTVKYKEHPISSELILAEGQLAGVLPKERGKGINKQMLIKRLEIVSEIAEVYEVGTQIYNYASQKTFYSCGLEPIASYFTYHKNVEL